MNWDNPLSRTENIISEITLNEHHGLSLNTNEWINLVGCKEGDRFYDCYLRFCELMNSPLGKALS